MYKLITGAKETGDLPIGFDRDRGRRQRDLTDNKNKKGKCLVRNMLKDVFSFAQHQEKPTYGLGYNLTLTRIVDNTVLKKSNATNIGKNKFISIEWYVPQ